MQSVKRLDLHRTEWRRQNGRYSRLEFEWTDMDSTETDERFEGENR